MNGQSLKRMGRWLGMVCAGTAWAAVDPDPVPEFISDTSSYVVLTASDPGAQAASFAAPGRWSDGAAPSGERDYLVQGNRVLRVGDAGGTFAGRSLTLDNGRIKTSNASGTSVTFPDLRIFGGRLEQSMGNTEKGIEGAISVYGTADVPARISGSSGRTFQINAQLKGEAENVVKVMKTEEDGMGAGLFRCWFNNTGNAQTYRGRFVVAGADGNYGHNVALCTRSLRALGAGDPDDPDAATSVVTLRDRAAFLGADRLAFTNPAYSITVERAGTLMGAGGSAWEPAVTFGGGVRIAGTEPGATLYVRGGALVAFGNVRLANIAGLVVENGAVAFGPDYPNGTVPVTLAPGAEIQGAATVGALTLQSSDVAGGARFAPGAAVGEVGTLACASARVEGCVTGVLDIAYAEGVLSADRLALSGPLLKEEGGRIVFQISSFPVALDWHGSVRLLSAPNLGEAGSLGVDDIAITGFPSAWTAIRSPGTFSIEAEGDMKHLVWTATEDIVAPVVRIMPLGDSITYGSQSALAGYREPLYRLLVDAGYQPDFVGTLQTSAGSPVSDPDHEGHRGWVIARDGNPGRDGLYEHVETWLNAVETPHIILLHIGTNDLEGDDFAHAKDRLARLVDRLSALRPATWVVVTTLLPRTDKAAYNTAIDEQFNPFVAEIVRSRRALGRRVAFLDLHAVVSADQLADGVHPNDAGYAALAQAWFGAVRAIMPSNKVAPSDAQTELIALTGVNGGMTTSWNTPLQWSDGRAPAPGGFYFVPTNTLLRTPDNRAPAPFAGESLVFKGGRANLKHADSSTATANWVLFDCRLAHGCGRSGAPWTMGIGGTVDVRGTAEAPTVLTGSGAVGTRVFAVSAALRGAADAYVRMARTEGEGDSVGCGFQCFFTGDNAAYRGRFAATSEGGEVTAWRLGFGSSAALGAPVADGAKVTLGDGMTLAGAGLAFTNGYALALEGAARLAPTGAAEISGRRPGEGFYFGRGGSVTGTGASVVRVAPGAAVALDDVAFSGVEKIVAEAGASLRVYPGYRQADLPIELHDAALVDTSDGVGPVTLKAGGSLRPGFLTMESAVGALGMASLTVEEGGSLVLSVVKREDGTVTNDFVRVAGNVAKRTAGPIPIVFDRYPSDTPAGTRVSLFSAANLGRDVTAADFTVACHDEFLNALVRGRFEVADVGGVPTLVFVQTSAPVVDLLGQDSNGADSWASKGRWSDGAAPHAACNYRVAAGRLLRRSVRSDGETFAGQSLSITRGGDFAINGLTARVEDLRLFSDGILSTRNDGDANRLCGTATVYAAKGTPFSFEIENGGATRTLNLEAMLKGTGDLRFRYYHTSNGTAEMPTTFYRVTGDNTAFTGGVELFQRAVCVDFANERAMGGPAAAFRADRLLFTSNATLRCSASYVMRDPTRGITFGAGDAAQQMDGGRIRVEEGQTLVISNLISGTTSLRKTGAGTLVLCCPTNAFSGVIRNQDVQGVLAVGAADAVAQASLQGFAGAIWRVDAPEGMTVRALDAILPNGDGNGALDVRPGALPSAASGTKVTVNLVRFKGATAADAEAALARVRLDAAAAFGRGWKVEVVAEEVADGLLVVAHARRMGSAIIFR